MDIGKTKNKMDNFNTKVYWEDIFPVCVIQQYFQFLFIISILCLDMKITKLVNLIINKAGNNYKYNKIQLLNKFNDVLH